MMALALSQPERRVITMESFEIDKSICSTCIHIESCEHYQTCRQPIWFCENFDCAVPGNTEQRVESVVPAPPTPPENGFMGLCINCDHRETCINAKKPGGVWHCEEYL